MKKSDWIHRSNIFVQSENATTLVEFAVIAALFFGILMGMLGFVLFMWQINTLQYAVENAARCKIINQFDKTCVDEQTSGMKNSLGFEGILAASNFTSPGAAASAPAGTVCVQADSATLIGPFNFISYVLPIRAIATYCRAKQ